MNERLTAPDEKQQLISLLQKLIGIGAGIHYEKCHHYWSKLRTRIRDSEKDCANSGIEYRLILACRNVQKGEDAKKSSCIKVNAFNPGLMKTNFMPLTKASMAFVKMSMPERYGDLDKSSTALCTACHRGRACEGVRSLL